MKKQQKTPKTEIRMCPKYNSRQIATEEQESTLVEYILRSAEMFYGLTTTECRKLAFEMATVNSISMPDTWKTNGLAGIEWLRSFMNHQIAGGM